MLRENFQLPKPDKLEKTNLKKQKSSNFLNIQIPNYSLYPLYFEMPHGNFEVYNG